MENPIDDEIISENHRKSNPYSAGLLRTAIYRISVYRRFGRQPLWLPLETPRHRYPSTTFKTQ